MQRLFEWLKLFINEKINVFVKGFIGGTVVSGIFLFGSNITSTHYLIYAYLLKLFAVIVSGFISGFATILGNDVYHWAKNKILNRKPETKKRQKRRAA